MRRGLGRRLVVWGGVAALLTVGSAYLASNSVAASSAGELQVPVNSVPPPVATADLVISLPTAVKFTGTTADGTGRYTYGPTQGASSGSWTQRFTVKNVGAATSNTLSLTGGTSTFSITSTACDAQKLAPTGTCTFTINAVGESPGTATILVNQQSNGEPYIALKAVSAVAVAPSGTPDLRLSAGTLERTTDEGTNQYLTTSFHSQTFTVTNTGNAASTTLGISLVELMPSPITLTISTDSSCQDHSLVPGGQCTITITEPALIPPPILHVLPVPVAMVFVNAEDSSTSYISLGLTLAPLPVPLLALSPVRIATITTSAATASYHYFSPGTWSKTFTVMNVSSLPTRPISLDLVVSFGLSISTDTCEGQVLTAGETCSFTASTTSSTFAGGLVQISVPNSPLQIALELSNFIP